MRVRVKICGITRVEDARAAVAAGADAIGLVFHPDSPRAVEISQAQGIVAAVPALVSIVGLFVDAPVARIREVLAQVPLDLLQFHGQESADQCRQYGRRYIKALRMSAQVDISSQARTYEDAAGLLLDAYSPDVAGGSGQTFDWTQVPANLGKPVILAGGLTPLNVAQAIAHVRPYAVDVSSGVEHRPGIKDADKINAFVRATR